MNRKSAESVSNCMLDVHGELLTVCKRWQRFPAVGVLAGFMAAANEMQRRFEKLTEQEKALVLELVQVFETGEPINQPAQAGSQQQKKVH